MGVFSDFFMSTNRGAPREKPTPKPRPKQIINVDEIQKIVFTEGDILFLKFKNRIPAQGLRYLMDSINGALSKVGLKGKIGVMIFDQPVDISIMTQDQKKRLRQSLDE